MDRFAFETLNDRFAPANLDPLSTLGNIVTREPSMPAEFTTVTRSTTPIQNTQPGFNHLINLPAPPQKGIEGTDVGGDTFYDYH